MYSSPRKEERNSRGLVNYRNFLSRAAISWSALAIRASRSAINKRRINLC